MAEELLELANNTRDYIHDETQRVHSKEIERRPATNMGYNEFFWNYMNANWPVVLTNVSTNWKCSREWTPATAAGTATTATVIPFTDINNCDPTTSSPSNHIDFDYLKSKMGNCTVPISDCSTEYFNSHAKREMQFFDFIDHWQSKIAMRSLSRHGESTDNKSTIRTTENLYLKDWHLRAQMPNYDFYIVPKQFASDWLNEYLVANNRDDYRFVYMGPQDTWTPFHADVFGSYSWSTNILGCKKWLLLPPDEECKLYDALGNLPFQISESKLLSKNVKFYTIYQREHETVFVPSGWFHQVWNLTDTISVNHNWFNGCNVQRIWKNFEWNMQQVVAEIDDCRQMDNFEDHCQMMLRASFGMNYMDFVELLEFIVKRRLNCGKNASISRNDHTSATRESDKCKYILNDFHIRFDVQSICSVAEMMLKDSVVSNSRAVLYRRCLQLYESTRGY